MDALFSFWLAILVCINIVSESTHHAGAQQTVGVNYGLLGNDLPAPHDAVAMFIARNVARVRLFEPNPDVLNALHNSNIAVVVGTLNADITPLATNPNFATQWVQTNIVPHVGLLTFRCISVGNEVQPEDFLSNVLPAMTNLQAALRGANINVPVSSAFDMRLIGSSYPPSAGVFSSAALPFMGPIAAFLQANNAPFLINAYSYYPYVGDPTHLSLEYALGTSTTAVIQDGPLSYFTLFDAMVDVVYAALEKVGAPNVEIVVTETGWPSGGGSGDVETVAHAQTYNNYIAGKVHAGNGTPRRPQKGLETYIFAMFNENLKPKGTEQYFGLFYPNLTQVYPFTF